MTLAGKHKLVPKLWGSECWIVNNDDYCGKILHLKPGFKSSLHYHIVKHETMLCLWGTVSIYADNLPDTRIFDRGDSHELPPGTYHSFEAVGGDAVLIEFSTHHDDDDVERVRDSTTTTTQADFTYHRNPVVEGFPMFKDMERSTPTLKWIIVLVFVGCFTGELGWALGNWLFR